VSMFQARLENSRGDIITLTGRESDYQILSITGLNPPSAHLNTSSIAGMDGALFNSSKLNTRNIVITAKINGNVEENRQELYRFCPTKTKVRFYFRNNHRDVYIDGYVDNVECNLFTNDERMQISIICPNPYFMDTEDTQVDGSSITALFTFPFSIDIGNPIPFSMYVLDSVINLYNDSDDQIGMLIDIDVNSSVDEILIRNTDTGDSFTLAYSFVSGDHITINTIK
jgi:predicted phage tail component-like protein